MLAGSFSNWITMAENALKTMVDLQSMIDIMSERLYALRDLRLQEFVKQEIRSLEGKLLKQFWRQLVAKAQIPKDQWLTSFQSYPSLSQWLSVVGISSAVKEKLVSKVDSVEIFLAMSEKDVFSMLGEFSGDSEDERKITSAVKLLKRFDKFGDVQQDTDAIYWDSWTKPSQERQNNEDLVSKSEFDHNENIHVTNVESSQDYQNSKSKSRSKTNSSQTECEEERSDGEAMAYSTRNPSVCSRSSLSSMDLSSPTTKRLASISAPKETLHFAASSGPVDIPYSASQANQWTMPMSDNGGKKNSGNNLSVSPFGPIRPARSYEWQAGSHITASKDESLTDSSLSLTSLTMLPPTSSNSSGPKLFSAKKKKKRPGNIIIQRDNPPDLIDLLRPSTAGPRRMSQTNVTNADSHPASSCGSPVSPGTPMTPGTPIMTDLMTNHRESSWVAPQTPKTPSRFKGGLRAIKDKIKDKIGRSKLKRNKSEERVIDDNIEHVHHHKTRSETCPSINVSGVGQKQDYHTDDSRNSTPSSTSSSQFMRLHMSNSFDVSLLSSERATPTERSFLADRDVIDGSQTSLKDTEDTLTEYTEQSNLEDTEISENEAQEARANLMRQSSTMSNVLEEWDIPWDELVLVERIGQGRVGSVYRGKWHGEVAIRVIDVRHNDEFKLRAFKNEVMLYKKTRHDNVELFMGSCMSPSKLAIITGYCRGKSLYHSIRNSKDISLNSAKIISQHVAQGMGYLHSRGIIHKDLKSKNIFVDGKRVTITDFGLMGLHAISTKSIQMKPRMLQIPDGWLCYMAPEIIRALKVPEDNTDVVSSLPYTKESDVFAFGTIWYELLTGSWPFSEYPPEAVIWQVGNGKKQSLAHLQGAKELKEILMSCWCYDPSHRPDFSDSGIMGQLMSLPQAKIIRRSSQPIKGNKKTGRTGGVGSHDRFFDLNFPSVLHELAEVELQ